ncbi:MAG: hypothetical protein NT030_05895 [Candidatus Saganbacteria bacterium]|nr:hypothetical protein [Candidatus Saganbacteria bacterium]
MLGLNERSVLIYSDGAVISKKVTTGLQEGELIEIVSGISADDQVIVVGQRLVKEGDKVQVSK